MRASAKAPVTLVTELKGGHPGANSKNVDSLERNQDFRSRNTVLPAPQKRPRACRRQAFGPPRGSLNDMETHLKYRLKISSGKKNVM